MSSSRKSQTRNCRRVAANAKSALRGLLATYACAFSIHAAGAESFPYVAYVIEADAYVRSGPGNQHYATGQLPAGYAVEVYRHDGEGWCAIRPPEGSFSVVAAHQLRILDSRTAEVTAPGVVARVGSSLGEQRNAVQVLLERGEMVELVGQPTPGQPWVKVAPPAGEFRWIASRRLSPTPPTEGAQTPAFESNWVARPESSKGAADSPPTTPLEKPQEVAPRTNMEGSSPEGQDGFAHLEHAVDDDIEVVAGSPAEVLLAQHHETAPRDAASSTDEAPRSGQPRIRFHGLSATGAPDARVAEMQLRLSQIVVQPPPSWQLAGLRGETAALLAQEQSPQVRAQLRDLLDRIATFETVAVRYRNGPLAEAAANPVTPAAPIAMSPQAPTNTPAPAPGMTGQTSDVLARVRADLGIDPSITPTPGTQPPLVGIAASGSAQAPAATEALYDAVGTLKPVVSRRDQAPRYALVDDHGDVVTFVTASADVNLQPYVGKRIGVRGARGFMPEYRRAHVTASRVTPLEEKLMR